MERDEFSDNIEDVLDTLQLLKFVSHEHYWPNCGQHITDARRSLMEAQEIANTFGEGEDED